MQGTATASETRQWEAWRGFIRAHASLVDQLDRELVETHGLPLHEFEVLLLLERAEHGRLRMSELADRALLSQSGLTRLVDRLERTGLVERVRCAADRRGLYATLTDEGRRRFAETSRTNFDGVRRLFFDRLSPEQIEVLAGAWETLIGPDAGKSLREAG
jgi:DNA-binding MarR family transcriptional regulator